MANLLKVESIMKKYEREGLTVIWDAAEVLGHLAEKREKRFNIGGTSRR